MIVVPGTFEEIIVVPGRVSYPVLVTLVLIRVGNKSVVLSIIAVGEPVGVIVEIGVDKER